MSQSAEALAALGVARSGGSSIVLRIAKRRQMNIIDAGLGKRGGQLARTLLARRTVIESPHLLAARVYIWIQGPVATPSAADRTIHVRQPRLIESLVAFSNGGGRRRRGRSPRLPDATPCHDEPHHQYHAARTRVCSVRSGHVTRAPRWPNLRKVDFRQLATNSPRCSGCCCGNAHRCGPTRGRSFRLHCRPCRLASRTYVSTPTTAAS